LCSEPGAFGNYADGVRLAAVVGLANRSMTTFGSSSISGMTMASAPARDSSGQSKITALTAHEFDQKRLDDANWQ
jgi:hypothetical protein